MWINVVDKKPYGNRSLPYGFFMPILFFLVLFDKLQRQLRISRCQPTELCHQFRIFPAKIRALFPLCANPFHHCLRRDGFEIAREDLKLRGPGDFFGTKQSGTMQFALGDIYANADIMKEASEAVDFMREDGYQFEEIAPYALDEYLEYAHNI